MQQASPHPGARLFFAVWPAEDVRDAIAACRDQIDWVPGTRPVVTAKLHMTLHFLGHHALNRVAPLAEALQVAPDSFELHLDKIECWPGDVTVLRPQHVPPALLRLRADLASRLHGMDIPVESRPFRPHVTLARHGRPRQVVELERPVTWPVDTCALVESTAGASYRVVRQYR